MWQLAGLVTAAVAVIVAVARWSLRGARESGDEIGPSVRTARPAPVSGRPIVPSARAPMPGDRVVAGSRFQRQGENVAKSRGRFGISERVGWLRRTDVDEEMWPAEGFGGVSDEQFWDDLSADKPLATKARTATAQPGGGARARESASRPAADKTPRAAKPAIPQPLAPQSVAPASVSAQSVSAAATTASFPAARPTALPASAAAHSARAGTHAQPILPLPTAPSGPLQAAGPYPASTGAYPAIYGGYPATTGPLQASTGPLQASTGPLPAGPGPTPAGQGQPRSRRRHAADDDPLTSAAYSVRATGDGRSYSSSRRDPYPAQPGGPGGYAGYEPRGRVPYGSAPDPGDPYGSGGYPVSDGYGSGPNPAAGRHSSGTHRRETYPGADTYQGGAGYRDSGYAAPYPTGPAGGVPTPPYGERYAPPARDYPAGDRASRDNGRAPDRDSRSPYQRPLNPRGDRR